jgi:ABC-type sugar transport system ATPase subunit
MANIQLQNVSKVYGNGVRALTGVNLEIGDGEWLVLVGPSGCGKTTTLRLIAGLDNPSSGQIHIAGRSMSDVPPWQRDIAMVFQKPALLPSRTVRANLKFGHELRRGLLGNLLRRLSPNHRAELARETQAVEEVARLLGLEQVLDRKPAELSGGQLQRVALGRSLIRPASIRLLDEPLGQLDGPLRRQLRRELHLLQRQFPATIVHVTHDSEEALALGERIAVLHDGVLLQVDSAEALLSAPRHRFVAEFFPTDVGPLNFLAGRVLEEAGSTVCQVGRRNLAPPPSQREVWRKNVGRDVVVGVRPDDVCIQWQDISPAKGWLMRVLLVEPWGRGALVLFEGEGLRIAAFVEHGEAEKVVRGMVAAVGIRLERSLLFDASSGLNLECERK